MSAPTPLVERRQISERDEVEAAAPGLRRKPDSHRPQAGLAVWGLEAAYYHDLHAVSYIEIAEKLQYHDWEFAHPERSKAAERRVRDGRQLLHDLDAWPWALVDKGRLPNRWWEQDLFAEALARWVSDAILMTVSGALRTLEIAASGAGANDEKVWVASVTAWDAARAALRDIRRSIDAPESEAA